MNRSIIWVITMLLSLNSHAFFNYQLSSIQEFSSSQLIKKTPPLKFNFIPFEFTVDKVNNNLSVAGGNSASISVITTGSNLTYKWQVSTNNGTSYTNLSNGSEYSGVSNSTLVLNSVNASMQGYMFRCEVSDGTTSDYSGITSLNILASPLCSSNPTAFGYEYVSEVVINGVTIQGSTDFLDNRGYRDFTNIAIPAITAGTSFPVSVTVKTNSVYQEYVKFWLDFDKNGVPGNTENELVFNQVNTFNGTHTYSGNINIPADALNGTLYARMIMQYAGSPNVCGTYSYGNTYDFKIPITGGQLSQTLSVAVNKAGNSNGGVTSFPAGINTTGNIFSVNTLQGVNYSLTATPSAGSKFLGWSGDIESLQNPLTFTIESDLNILAKFAPGNLPTVVIKSNEVLSSTSVTVNAEVTDLGDAAVTERGFVIGTSQNPTTSSGTKYAKGSGLGVFSHTITGLNAATTYYVRAYAISAVGTTYSDQQIIDLNKISQSITASNISATFGDAALLIGASATSELPLSYTSSNNTIAEPYQDAEDENKWKIRFKKAGSVTLTIAQSGNDTYSSASKEITITIGKKPITITPTANQKKVFGESNPVYAYTPSPALLGTDAFTGALARITGENVGIYDYNLGTLSAGDNYELTLATGSIFAITKKAITITATANQKKVYGESNPVYWYRRLYRCFSKSCR
ncbi:MAG: hypothetical protein EOO99_08520 [Pedobacter sp.]|nr:MAG: hypothetical protein EOO99_08520 [Pedobacter sp.]